MSWRPLCAESIRWAAVQLSERLKARGLDFGSEGEVAEFARQVNGRLAREWQRLEHLVADAERRCYYFGCWDRSGHFWHDQHGRSLNEPRTATPTGSISTGGLGV